MTELKPCPFCGGTDIYETYSQEYAFSTKNPEIFCNSCKAIFSIEDDSPYMNCDEDYAYRKKKTVEAWNKRNGEQPYRADGVRDAIITMSGLPSAEPERKTGKWIVYKAPDQYHCGMVKCPFCGEDMIAESDEYNYCPNCGARMNEG